MYPRTNYEMTEDDLKELLDACKPTPVIMIGNYVPASPQENANRAWARLGEKMGFDSDTVRPIPGKGNRFFAAVPSETEIQKVMPLVEGKVRIIHKYNKPYGIRDETGFLFFFSNITKYHGQEERYRSEVEQQYRLADYLMGALEKA